MSARSALVHPHVHPHRHHVVGPAVAECEARVRRPIVQLEGLLVVSPMYKADPAALQGRRVIWAGRARTRV